MSTLDDLRERKRQLLEQKKEAEQAGETWEAAFVNEELLSVNAQLRELVGKRRVQGARATSKQWASDLHQYEEWARRDEIEEAKQARAALRERAADSLEELTLRQREILTLYAGGMRQQDIAVRLGVDPSTVSRTLARAKANAAETIRKTETGAKLLEDGEDGSVDLRKEDALRAVVQTLTPKQLVYFYLYYSEGLHLREVETLTGTSFTSVSRTIKRALLKLDVLFPDGAVLDHPEAVDEAAYWAWRELGDHPELAPEPVRELLQQRGAPPEKYDKQDCETQPLPEPKTTVRQAERGRIGKLLAALLERQREGLFRWLEHIFETLKRRWEGSRL